MNIRVHFYNIDKLRLEAKLLHLELLKNCGDVVPGIKRLQRLHDNIREMNVHALSKNPVPGSPKFHLLQLLTKQTIDETDRAGLNVLCNHENIQEAQDLLHYWQFQEDYQKFQLLSQHFIDHLLDEAHQLKFEGDMPHEVAHLFKLGVKKDALEKISELRVYLDKMVRKFGFLGDNKQLSLFCLKHLDLIYTLVYGVGHPIMEYDKQEAGSPPDPGPCMAKII